MRRTERTTLVQRFVGVTRPNRAQRRVAVLPKQSCQSGSVVACGWLSQWALSAMSDAPVLPCLFTTVGTLAHACHFCTGTGADACHNCTGPGLATAMAASGLNEHGNAGRCLTVGFCRGRRALSDRRRLCCAAASTAWPSQTSTCSHGSPRQVLRRVSTRNGLDR